MSRRVNEMSRTIDEIVSTAVDRVRIKEAEVAAVRAAAPRNKTAEMLREVASAVRASNVDVTYSDLAACMEAAR